MSKISTQSIPNLFNSLKGYHCLNLMTVSPERLKNKNQWMNPRGLGVKVVNIIPTVIEKHS